MSPADSPFAPLPAPGPHPATAELRAYAAGTLAPADEHRIEAHTMDCERCADVVEGFSMTDEATTNQAVAGLRTRLSARVGTAEPEPATGWAWPRVAAAAALLAAVGGGIWGVEQQKTTFSPAVARQETLPSAEPIPAAASPKGALQPSIPTKAEEAPPLVEKKQDYAAVTPSRAPQMKSRRAAPRPPQASVAAEEAVAEMANASDVTAGAPVLNEEKRADLPMAPDDAKMASAAPAKKSAAYPSGRTLAPDTTAGTKAAVTMATARALPPLAGLAAARVANTPMPAAAPINPAPVGGTVALRDYLRREAAEFQPEINALHLTGTVRIQFVVGADGKVSNLKVVRGLRPDYDAEALRIVCDGPVWQPGIAAGRRTALPMEITVPF